ncbi:DNA replication/repair protein RecF [Ruminococcus sp. Marseille-P6503]|uniref:DNA replication/repair protein RecF n=1 Tax=Ruminococcus sp. Marseille-P6503 TaxID=2364796 RepID=UPI000F5340A9|nr:DNA replication/repair protein RecF [Ruminococcus sp. Marseille-P6503]
MHITKLCVNGFKNLKNIEIYPHPSLNIFCGDNAQGKTNLIEAIWLCSGAKSFRGTKDKGMIDMNGESMSIELKFKNSRREQTIAYSMARPNVREKSCKLNGVRLSAPSKLFGNLDCVVFTPEDLGLSKGFPEKRRQFLDLSVSQIKLSYGEVAAKYDQLIEQRNSLLKNIAFGRSVRDELEVWDIQLARMGAYISLLRYNYAKKLNLLAGSLYSEISGGEERLELRYCSTVFDSLEGRQDYKNDLSEEYLRCLENNREEDIRAGFTQKGVHRDDLAGFINRLSVRDFASQGQHRSAALVMKLAQAYILAEETGEAPCILLDDVLSELDPSRQEFAVAKIKGMQVFITCCDEAFPFEGRSGKLYRIKNGRIIS